MFSHVLSLGKEVLKTWQRMSCYPVSQTVCSVKTQLELQGLLQRGRGRAEGAANQNYVVQSRAAVSRRWV